MVIVFKLKSELGEFTSEEMTVNEDQFNNLVEKSRTFYSSGYDMWLENGFLVASPEIIKKSILIIEVINN
jgi:hypothetical protein